MEAAQGESLYFAFFQELRSMRFIKNILTVVLIYPFFFSCTHNAVSGKAPVKKVFTYRALSDSEKLYYNQRLTKFFDSLLLRGGFSGGILVAKNNQVLYEHYQGFSDAYRHDSINENTPFHVASTSKTFTSTAVLQLVQAGKLSLDDSLSKFFPQFPYPGNTVRTLLSHSSGIPYYANFMDKYGWDRSKTATNADVLYSLYANRPPQEFSPGSRFRYCNTNFVLLALIVEKVTGRFFPDVVHDSIFNKCGMTHSYVVSQKNPQDFIPSFYGGRFFGFDYLDGVYGDKNVFTTCRDMMKYDSCIRENVMLNQALYDSAWKPYFKDTHYRSTSEYYGLGWRLNIFPDSLVIPYHNGWWHGNNSVFQRVIADTAVIIVTGNRFASRIYQSAKAANIFRPYYFRGDVEDETQADQQRPVRTRTVKHKSVVSSSSKRHAAKGKKAGTRRRKR